MSERPVGQVERSISSLAELHLPDETLDSVLLHIGRLGVDALEGWDAVAASIVEGNKVATYGTTDERINQVDQAQYDTGRGPCVDAMKSGESRYFDGTAVAPEWRLFAESAADVEVYSVVSFPMKIDDTNLGALNFYSRERDALRPGQTEDGWVFASQAAVALSNVRTMASKAAEVEQLEEGLKTRTLIGQATGLLMAQEGLTSEESFQKLVTVSQNANMKLRDIAARYVETWEGRVKKSPQDP